MQLSQLRIISIIPGLKLHNNSGDSITCPHVTQVTGRQKEMCGGKMHVHVDMQTQRITIKANTCMVLTGTRKMLDKSKTCICITLHGTGSPVQVL